MRTGMTGRRRRSAVSTSTRTGSDSSLMRSTPPRELPNHFGPTIANSTPVFSSVSLMCWRKSMPAGMLSMSRKIASLPYWAIRRSKMRPVIASESARRYEIVIFGIRQSPAGILTRRPLTAAADSRDAPVYLGTPNAARGNCLFAAVPPRVPGAIFLRLFGKPCAPCVWVPSLNNRYLNSLVEVPPPALSIAKKPCFGQNPNTARGAGRRLQGRSRDARGDHQGIVEVGVCDRVAVRGFAAAQPGLGPVQLPQHSVPSALHGPRRTLQLQNPPSQTARTEVTRAPRGRGDARRRRRVVAPAVVGPDQGHAAAGGGLSPCAKAGRRWGADVL